MKEFKKVTNKYSDAIELNPYFWECNCDRNFIHSRAHELYCNYCGASAKNSPDAFETNVIACMENIQRVFNKLIKTK